ncbi:unnamed protein product, partial [Phaeothamnion confervicola]
VDAASFSLLAVWKEKGSPMLDLESGEVIAPAEFPMLFRMACLYHSIEGTSGQAERNFSALASMLNDLRSRLTPFAVGMCMLLRINRNRVAGID